MKLELDEAEREMTLNILQNRLGELRQEIHHSIVSHFTDQVKETEVRLKGVIEKLGAQESTLRK